MKKIRIHTEHVCKYNKREKEQFIKQGNPRYSPSENYLVKAYPEPVH